MGSSRSFLYILNWGGTWNDEKDDGCRNGAGIGFGAVRAGNGGSQLLGYTCMDGTNPFFVTLENSSAKWWRPMGTP